MTEFLIQVESSNLVDRVVIQTFEMIRVHFVAPDLKYSARRPVHPADVWFGCFSITAKVYFGDIGWSRVSMSRVGTFVRM